MSILDILNQLAADNSRKYKLSVLQVNTDNILLKEVIRLALDPMTQFYIRKIPKYKISSLPIMTLEDALKDLNVLSSREKTGHDGISHLSNILSQVNESDAEVIKRIISKDLRCGVAEATVNEVWPNLIFEYPMMHSTAFSQKEVDKFIFPAWAQLKYDGMRFNAIVMNGKCEYRTRNGKIIDLLGHLESEFIEMGKDHHIEFHLGKNLVFDGELLVLDNNGKLLDRKTGNGILNKAVKGTISIEEAKRVKAVLWDVLTWDELSREWCEVDYYNRFRRFHHMKLSPGIELVDNIRVNNIDEATREFNAAIENGYEGIILKSITYNWENKRSKGCLKFKSEKECDLRITDVILGSGKYSNMMGALRCASDEGLLEVSVGSGFNEHERMADWNSKLGKIITVRYNERITSKTGGPISLFLPRFIEERHDKTVADKISEIK